MPSRRLTAFTTLTLFAWCMSSAWGDGHPPCNSGRAANSTIVHTSCGIPSANTCTGHSPVFAGPAGVKAVTTTTGCVFARDGNTLTASATSLNYATVAGARYLIVDRLIDQVDTDGIPKDVVRAIAWQESGWRQWDDSGGCFRCDHDFGVMQVHDADVLGHPEWSLRRAKRSTRYNIWLGVQILREKLAWVRDRKRRPDWPAFVARYHLKGMTDLGVAILAYNGMRRNKCYVDAIRCWYNRRPWEVFLPPRELEAVE
jgi:hypothetical protein